MYFKDKINNLTSLSASVVVKSVAVPFLVYLLSGVHFPYRPPHIALCNCTKFGVDTHSNLDLRSHLLTLLFCTKRDFLRHHGNRLLHPAHGQ